MRKKKTTSTDIAKAAGVSQSAVSMILNKKYNVSFSKETVENENKNTRKTRKLLLIISFYSIYLIPTI